MKTSSPVKVINTFTFQKMQWCLRTKIVPIAANENRKKNSGVKELKFSFKASFKNEMCST